MSESAAPANGPTRAQIVAMARDWLGTPYQHQASVKKQGTDCLGLIRGLWRELYGYEPEAVPAYAADWQSGREGTLLQMAVSRHLVPAPAGDMQPGNVLLFRMQTSGPARHLGLVSDQGRFIHAYAGRCVTESWLSRWWLARLVSTHDFPGVTS